MELNIYQSNRLRKTRTGRHLMILSLAFGLVLTGYLELQTSNYIFKTGLNDFQTKASSAAEAGKEKETTDRTELSLFRSMLFLMQD